jgi:nucleoside-diphosphate-sugar epimerase
MTDSDSAVAELKGVSVLVTGAAGFIGSHLVRRLLADGAKVSAVVEPGVSVFRIQDILSRLSVFELDLGDPKAIQAAAGEARPRKIFHLAARTNVARGFSQVDASLDNIRLSLNLIRTLENGVCDAFVSTGTCEEYGDNAAPFREDQIPKPVSPYSASKAAITLYCQMFHKTQGLPIVVLRPFLAYGPCEDPSRFISTAITATLTGRELPMTGGEQTREFNYVSDIVDGFVKASCSPAAIGEIINIGNGIEYTLKDVVERISSIAGRPLTARFGALPYRSGEAWHFYGDNTKAKRLLNWSPKVDLDAGLRMTIDWYRKQSIQPGTP